MRRTLRAALLPVLALLGACHATSPAPAPFPAADGAVRAAVLATIDSAFAAMRARDTATLGRLVAPGVVLYSARDSAGASITREAPRDRFLAQVASAPTELAERIWAPEVRAAAGVASVWAWYDFHRGGRATNCGLEGFQLARVAGRWVITAWSYSVQPSPCPGTPPW